MKSGLTVSGRLMEFGHRRQILPICWHRELAPRRNGFFLAQYGDSQGVHRDKIPFAFPLCWHQIAGGRRLMDDSVCFRRAKLASYSKAC